MIVSKKIVFILVGFGLALFYAWSRIHVVELGYQVNQLRGEIEKLKQENGVLKSKLADALSTHHLLYLAKQHGMKEPQTDQIYFIPRVTE